MRVRCPKCSSVNEHPDDLGWRKTECPACFHPFVATKSLTVSTVPTVPTNAPAAEGKQPPAPSAATPARGPGRVLAIAGAGVLLLIAGVFARLWMVARGELRELRSELSDLAAPAGPPEDTGSSESAAGGETADRLGKVKEKLEADRILVALQEAMVLEMQSRAGKLEARIRTLETKVERGGNALGREREAHGRTKRKLDARQKETMALRRELDACGREIRALEMKLERGL